MSCSSWPMHLITSRLKWFKKNITSDLINYLIIIRITFEVFEYTFWGLISPVILQWNHTILTKYKPIKQNKTKQRKEGHIKLSNHTWKAKKTDQTETHRHGGIVMLCFQTLSPSLHHQVCSLHSFSNVSLLDWTDTMFDFFLAFLRLFSFLSLWFLYHLSLS